MFNKNKFKGCVYSSGLTMKEVALKLGINETTLYRKINRDGDFSRSEINELIELLKITNPNEIFFNEKLT